MNPPGQRVDAVRILGTIALATGLLIAGVGLAAGNPRADFFAGMLVVTGVGLRLEAALSEDGRQI